MRLPFVSRGSVLDAELGRIVSVLGRLAIARSGVRDGKAHDAVQHVDRLEVSHMATSVL